MSNEDTVTTASLLRRAELFLEDKEWDPASNYCQKVLDIEPENARAYFLLLLSSLKVSDKDELINSAPPFADSSFFQKALRFSDPEYKKQLEQCIVDNILLKVRKITENAKRAEDFRTAMELLTKIADLTDVGELMDNLGTKAHALQKQEDYYKGIRMMNSGDIGEINQAIKIFEKYDFEDAAKNIEKCKSLIPQLEAEKSRKLKKKKIAIMSAVLGVMLLTLLILSSTAAANKKKAAEIYDNFLGLSFSGSTEDDDGFSEAYYKGQLSQYTTYWNTTEENTLTFNEDGSVDYLSTYDMTVLAYPKSIAKPDGYHNEYEGTYNSFSVSVSFNGTAYLKIGIDTYELLVDSDNIPKAIYDYDGMTLR